MTVLKIVFIGGVLIVVAALGFAYSGLYPIGADTPHFAVTNWYLETLRERSITHASSEIEVPLLDDPDLLLRGGPDYNDMCAGCHLKPGKTQSDLSIGLYPTPPNLASKSHGHSHSDDDSSNDNQEQLAQRRFWIIKHGIKATGMPAWGPTHDDQRIWAMVAFLDKLPELDQDQYQILTARSGDSSHGH